MSSRPLYDAAAVLARLGVGVVFMAHGWQKIEAGVTATSRSFDGLGVPLPTAAAVYSAFVELLGGAALIAGLGLPITGVLLFVDMAGAFVFVHAAEGLFMVDGGTVENGYELVLTLGMASLLFAAGGGGRLTVDQWIVRKRLRRPDGAEDDDAQSFVESLRQADLAPAGKPGRKPPSPRSSKTPAVTAPDPAEGPAKAPGATAGTEDDTLVAGQRKHAKRRRASGTQPIKRGPGDDTDPV